MVERGEEGGENVVVHEFLGFLVVADVTQDGEGVLEDCGVRGLEVVDDVEEELGLVLGD